MKFNTYNELIAQTDERPKMQANCYWGMLVDNANLIFREVNDTSKAQVAKDLNLTPQEFTVVFKIVSAIFFAE